MQILRENFQNFESKWTTSKNILRYIWLNGDFLNEFDYLPAENTN